jgi:hypothetical protein
MDSRARETHPKPAPQSHERRLPACRSGSTERQTSPTRQTVRSGAELAVVGWKASRGTDGVAPPAGEVKGFAPFFLLPDNPRESPGIRVHALVRSGRCLAAVGVVPSPNVASTENLVAVGTRVVGLSPLE